MAVLSTTDTLIVSDLHLGIPASRPNDVLELLQHWHFDRLILLGDIFHDLHLRHFGVDAWRLLRHLRALATGGSTEVVWIKGNHDRELHDVVALLTGIKMRESYRWSCGGRSHLALHGDRFDRFVTNNRRLSRGLSGLYGFCQRRLSRQGRWPGVFDRLHNRLGDLGEEVAMRASRFAMRRAADVVFCGHTHEPVHRRFRHPGSSGDVDYYNAGSWVARPASFLAVDADGVRIQHHP
jgi:UDP-2,3-diacylglucosamine pyrophosphatase LpxH